MTKGCESKFRLIKDCPHKKGKGSKGGKGAFIVDGPKPLTGAGAGIPWFGFNTGATSSGAAPATSAYGSGSVSFFATDSAIPKTLENSASVAGSKGFTGVVIAPAVPKPIAIEDKRAAEAGPNICRNPAFRNPRNDY